MKTKKYKLMARLGYLSLLLLVPAWHLWLSPPPLSLNPWLITSIWFIPLLVPLWGIIKDNVDTFAWCAPMGSFYIIHAGFVIYNAYLEHVVIEIQLAIFEIIAASLFLVGSICHTKCSAKELGLDDGKSKDKSS